MKETRLMMGMPITIEVVDDSAGHAIKAAFDYLVYVDETFSTYKETSEISQINAGQLTEERWSEDMREVMALCEKTRQESHGYFNAEHEGYIDPSGIVKGWAIQNAAALLGEKYQNYYVDAGGDIQVAGKNSSGEPWRVGIRSPFNRQEVVKTLALSDAAIATSGSYIRGQHIYDPHHPTKSLLDIVSLSVIGPSILDADRFATAAFAMQNEGIDFIASLPGLEGYMITKDGLATFTSGFSNYIFHD